MNNTQNPEFTWKRQPDGHYVARHGFWVYDVWRDDRAARGHQWNLTAYPEANPESAQERTGFDRASTAKTAAAHTGCFICGRAFPFGTLKRDPTRSALRQPVWVCREEEQCHAERDRITASTHNMELEFRRTDHDEILIREDEYGPQLVLRSAGQGTVVNVTEGDLDKVRDLVDTRRGAVIKLEDGVQTRTDCGHSFATCHSSKCFLLDNRVAYARKLAEIAEAKTRVRELEGAALSLRTRALETGTTPDEIQRIEGRPVKTKVCIGCEQPQGEPHLHWCPVVTGRLSTLPKTGE
jgi:hypothetical protein